MDADTKVILQESINEACKDIVRGTCRVTLTLL